MSAPAPRESRILKPAFPTCARVSSFGAREDDGRVAVEWETAAEVGTVAFEVERQDAASGRFACSNQRENEPEGAAIR